MKKFKKLSIAILRALIFSTLVSGVFSTEALAVEARISYPPCPRCGKGYLITKRDSVEIDDEEANCQHGGEGLDIWELRSQKVHEYCSECSYKYDYTDYLSQKLLFCPNW